MRASANEQGLCRYRLRQDDAFTEHVQVIPGLSGQQIHALWVWRLRVPGNMSALLHFSMLPVAQSNIAPYLDPVSEAARAVGIPSHRVGELVERWSELIPWPKARSVLSGLAFNTRVGVVTHCSEELGLACAKSIWPYFPALVPCCSHRFS